MSGIARILLLAGLAGAVMGGNASAENYCNIHHNCPDDGRKMSTAGWSRRQCANYTDKKGRHIFSSWGNGPASPHTVCVNIR